MYDGHTSQQLKVEIDDNILFAIWRIVADRADHWVKSTYKSLTGNHYTVAGLTERQAQEHIVSVIISKGDVQSVILSQSVDWLRQSDDWLKTYSGLYTEELEPCAFAKDLARARLKSVIEDRSINLTLLFLNLGKTIPTHKEKVSKVLAALNTKPFNGRSY